MLIRAAFATATPKESATRRESRPACRQPIRPTRRASSGPSTARYLRASLSAASPVPALAEGDVDVDVAAADDDGERTESIALRVRVDVACTASSVAERTPG